MSSISKSFELRLNQEERKVLKNAIKKIECIADDCISAELYLDVDGVFDNLYTNYRLNDGELSAIVGIEE